MQVLGPFFVVGPLDESPIQLPSGKHFEFCCRNSSGFHISFKDRYLSECHPESLLHLPIQRWKLQLAPLGLYFWASLPFSKVDPTICQSDGDLKYLRSILRSAQTVILGSKFTHFCSDYLNESLLTRFRNTATLLTWYTHLQKCMESGE